MRVREFQLRAMLSDQGFQTLGQEGFAGELADRPAVGRMQVIGNQVFQTGLEGGGTDRRIFVGFYLDPEPLTLEDAGRRLIRVRWAIGLIYFPPVDEESQDAAMEQLLTGSQAMLALFAQGYLTVGNRALHLTASAGKPDRDAAAVILQLDYLDQRPETEQAAAWMEQIHLTAEPKTEG